MTGRGRLVVSLDDGSWDGLSLTAVHAASEHLGGVPPVVVWRRGRMDEHLRAVAEVLLVDDLNERRLPRSVESTAVARVGSWIKNRALRRWLRKRRPIDGILAVGIPASRLAAFLPAPRPPVLCVVRPEEAFDLDAVTLARSLEVTFVVGTKEHQAALHELGVHVDDIVLDPMAVAPAPAALRSEASTTGTRRPGTLEVVAAGTQDWWTDPDPFFILIWSLREAAPGEGLHVTWLAPLAAAADLWPFEHERRNCGLEDVVTVDTSPTPVDALDRAQALLVTGRNLTFHRALVDEARTRRIPVVMVDDRRLDVTPELEQMKAWFDLVPTRAETAATPVPPLVDVIAHRLRRIPPGRP